MSNHVIIVCRYVSVSLGFELLYKCFPKFNSVNVHFCALTTTTFLYIYSIRNFSENLVYKLPYGGMVIALENSYAFCVTFWFNRVTKIRMRFVLLSWLKVLLKYLLIFWLKQRQLLIFWLVGRIPKPLYIVGWRTTLMDTFPIQLYIKLSVSDRPTKE